MAVKKGTKLPNVSSTMAGNKNAEKYTEQFAIDTLINIRDGLSDGTYHCKEAGYLKNKVSKETISYWVNEKFKSNNPVLCLKKEIDQMAEMVLCSLALNGSNNSSTAIFLLKAQYGYSDQPKPQQDNTLTIKIEYD